MADQLERFLVLCRSRVLHPEQAVRFEGLAEAARLDRRQPVVHVVQKVMLEAELVPQALEQLGREV